jgi:hypothetical protein
MPEPEEVVLTGAPNVDTDPENARGEIELTDDSGNLSVAELEALVQDESTRQKSRPRVA